MAHKQAVTEAAAQPLLQQATGMLDSQAREITAHWVDRLEAAIYAGRSDLGLEDIRGQAPVQSELGQGSTFSFSLPVAGGTAEPEGRHG